MNAVSITVILILLIYAASLFIAAARSIRRSLSLAEEIREFLQTDAD